MSQRRILSLWFPHLAAERVLRIERGLIEAPLAVVAEARNMQVIASLSPAAHAEGLRVGQPLTDARALVTTLVARQENPRAEAEFLRALRRWAGKFSPWVAEEGADALVIDLTGCAHLFGGEEALLAQAGADCADLGLTMQAGIADTVGAAWALARYAGQPGGAHRSGDAIDQEARATRSRAARRHWTRGGAAPRQAAPVGTQHRIAPPGRMRAAIGPLPVAALRLAPGAAAQLLRLGIRRIDDIAGLPRAALARRFGRDVVTRLDQALGAEPEPVSPARPPHHYATRLTLPEPIGTEADLAAAVDRLLGPLCAHLARGGRGARLVRLQVFRSDHSSQSVEVGLARPAAEADRIRPLLALKLGEIDAGFGIDRVRLVAAVTEPLHAHQHKGHFDAAAAVNAKLSTDTPIDDLIGRVGARIGLEAITRLYPADSHVPEKTATIMAAAWAGPATGDWPRPPAPRPALIFAPEPVTATDSIRPPATFRWRRRDFATLAATGPERIAPEWWLDDPAWRSGTRDYWQVVTESGECLWLFRAHGALASGGWFAHGDFG